MNTLKWNRIFVAVIYLTLMLTLTIGNVNASPMQQTETDFAAIDIYVTEQMNALLDRDREFDIDKCVDSAPDLDFAKTVEVDRDILF